MPEKLENVKGVVMRLSNVILLVAFLVTLADAAFALSNDVDLNKHVPLLFPAILIFFWWCSRYIERQPSTQTKSYTPRQYLEDAEAENDDGRIPDHAKMRARTPDGLG